jgi:hypothetical protein
MSRGADARRVGEERKVGNGDAAANRQTTRPNADGGPRSGGPRPRTKRTKNKLTGPAAETTLVVEVKIAIDELERPYALVTIGGARAPLIIVLAFRGTASWKNWETNIHARLVKPPNTDANLRVHEGFDRAFKILADSD